MLLDAEKWQCIECRRCDADGRVWVVVNCRRLKLSIWGKIEKLCRLINGILVERRDLVWREKDFRCREDFTCCVNGGRRANVMMEICHSGLFGSIGEQKK